MTIKSQITGLDPHTNAALLALLEKKRGEKQTGITPIVDVVEDKPVIREPSSTHVDKGHFLTSVLVNPPAIIEPSHDSQDNLFVSPAGHVEPQPTKCMSTEPSTVEIAAAHVILDDIDIAPIGERLGAQEPETRVVKIEAAPPPGAPIPDPLPLPEPIVKTLTQQWRDMDLIDLLPTGRRAEAAAILEADPNKRQILALCKLGTYDAFEVMHRLGMPDPFLIDLNSRPPDSHAVPTQPAIEWAGELPAFCTGNQCHDFDGGFCFIPSTSANRNLTLLKNCPANKRGWGAT